MSEPECPSEPPASEGVPEPTKPEPAKREPATPEPATPAPTPEHTPGPAPSTAPAVATTPAPASPKRAPTPEARAAALELAAALEQLAAREQELDRPSRLTRVASTLAVAGAGLAVLGVAYALRALEAWDLAATSAGSHFATPLPAPSGVCPLAGTTNGLAWAALGTWLAAILHVGRGGAGRFAGSVVAAGGLPIFVLASVLLSDASDLAHSYSGAGDVVSAAAMGATLGLVAGIVCLCAALTNPREGASTARFAAALVERPRGPALWLSFALAAILGFVVGAIVYATPDARLPGALQGSALALTLAVGASVVRARLWLAPFVAIPGGFAGACARTWGSTVTTSPPVRAFADFLHSLSGPNPDAAVVTVLLALGLVAALVGQALGQRIGPVARALGSTPGLAAAWLLLQPELAHTPGLPSLSSLLVGGLVVAWVPPVAERLAGSLAPALIEPAG